jgi:dUTP pyrophosphatase
MPKIVLERLYPDVVIPQAGTAGAAGYDVYAYITAETRKTESPKARVIEIPSGQRALIPTGLRMSIPDGWEVQVRPRSGLALKYGLTVLNAPGTIDSDYRGELGVILFNTSKVTVVIDHGDRVAQLLACPTYEIRFEEGSVDADTLRSRGGFGSTGK